MQSQSEKQRTKGITLLYSTFTANACVLVKKKMRRLPIATFCPGRETWKGISNLQKHGLTCNKIESVRAIDKKSQFLFRRDGIVLSNVGHRMNQAFASASNTNTQLKRR
jgi:hypothetical protein